MGNAVSVPVVAAIARAVVEAVAFDPAEEAALPPPLTAERVTPAAGMFSSTANAAAGVTSSCGVAAAAAQLARVTWSQS